MLMYHGLESVKNGRKYYLKRKEQNYREYETYGSSSVSVGKLVV